MLPACPPDAPPGRRDDFAAMPSFAASFGRRNDAAPPMPLRWLNIISFIVIFLSQ